MKLPQKPPHFSLEQKALFLSPKKFELIQKEALKTEEEGKYRPWDILRHLTPPEGLTKEEWWFGIKLKRNLALKSIPLQDCLEKDFFSYNLPSSAVELLHLLDLTISSTAAPVSIVNSQTKDQYMVRSLIQEAITSSQIEGATTTRKAAKEMLTSGRAARDKSEQMILNNFHVMEKIKTWKELPLNLDLILEIHRLITDKTLDKPEAAGRLRGEYELVIVVDTLTNEVLHQPPPALKLKERLQKMCDFANGKTPAHFIHPVIRAIILHFWLAYEHPFLDGNGRTARALFYWLMLRHQYWLFEFVSISEIILKAPAQYGEAFLYTESDANDLTYFILHQTAVVRKALQTLYRYVENKTQASNELASLMKKQTFNPRQEALLAHASNHTKENYTIEVHKNSHQIAYDTARQDLKDLQLKGFLEIQKKGKAFVFSPSSKFLNLIRRNRKT